jgi:hypothetical protein
MNFESAIRLFTPELYALALRQTVPARREPPTVLFYFPATIPYARGFWFLNQLVKTQ